MLSTLTSPTRSSVVPKPLLGALLGAFLISAASAASGPTPPDAPLVPDGAFGLSDAVPEPSYSLLGACLGCALLLHRRRSGDLVAGSRADREPQRMIRNVSSAPTRPPRLRRKAASRRLIDTPTTGRASLRPLRAS